jgi:hypothetical protein
MKILLLNLLFGVIVLLEQLRAAPRTTRRGAANRPRPH